MACEIGKTWLCLKLVAQSVQNTCWKPMLHCAFAPADLDRTSLKTLDEQYSG